jgi:Polyketide cyclase / dehydrase and lipid transport
VPRLRVWSVLRRASPSSSQEAPAARDAAAAAWHHRIQHELWLEWWNDICLTFSSAKRRWDGMPNVKEVAATMIDADTLWQRVGNFGSIAQWHPHLSRMTVSDEPAGQVRLLYLKTGGEQLERLQAIDAAHHTYRYRIERASLPVRDYIGEFRIEAADTQMSRVVWEADFTLADEHDDRTVAAVRSFLREGVASIERKYRPFERIEPDGVDRGIADADKKARTDTVNEPIRNTPPAGAWNDTSSD